MPGCEIDLHGATVRVDGRNDVRVELEGSGSQLATASIDLVTVSLEKRGEGVARGWHATVPVPGRGEPSHEDSWRALEILETRTGLERVVDGMHLPASQADRFDLDTDRTGGALLRGGEDRLVRQARGRIAIYEIIR